jgi:hypothetical protein
MEQGRRLGAVFGKKRGLGKHRLGIPTPQRTTPQQGVGIFVVGSRLRSLWRLIPREMEKIQRRVKSLLCIFTQICKVYFSQREDRLS